MNKPKILIDARMVSRFEHGISRYVTTIAAGLSARGALDYEPVFILSRSENLSASAPWVGLSCIETDIAFLSWKEWFEIPRLIRQSGAVAFHSPSFASFPFMRVPYMQTIHDLIHLHFGSMAQKMYYRLLLKRFARRARILATVSMSARNEIAKWLAVPPESIAVQVNTFDTAASFQPQELKWLRESGLEPESYTLVIANEKPHKNLSTLRQAAFASGVKLIVAHEHLNRFDRNRALPFALNALIRHARLVLSPSFIEGFGRVPIEALLLGTPVAVSDIEVHREILSEIDGIRFVTPSNVADWSSVMAEPRGVVDPVVQKRLLTRFAHTQLVDAVHASYLKLISR